MDSGLEVVIIVHRQSWIARKRMRDSMSSADTKELALKCRIIIRSRNASSMARVCRC